MDLTFVAILLIFLDFEATIANPVPCKITRVAKWRSWDDFNPFEATNDDLENTYKAAICQNDLPAAALPGDLEVLYLSGVDFADQAVTLRDLLSSLPHLVAVMIEQCDIAQQSTTALFRYNTELQYLSITQCVTSGNDYPATDMIQFSRKLEVLTLASSGIERVPATLLRRNTKLNIVDFSQNDLVTVDETLFANNAELVNVSFHGNRISELSPNLLHGLGQLEEFDVSNNELVNLPSGLFAENPLLQRTAFEANRISDLPSDIFTSNQRLRWVSFSNNRLRELPSGLFSHTPRLYVAKFANNAIATNAVPNDLLAHNPEVFYVTFRGNAGMLPHLRAQHHGIGKVILEMIARYGYDASRANEK